MTVDDLIRLLENRILTLNEAKKSAFTAGDLERVIQIELDLLTTQSSITQLRKS